VDKYLSKPLFPSAIADLINECLGAETLTQKEPPPEEAGVFKGYRVLLAEDVEINREIVLALLEPTLLNIDCAANGAEAIQLFAKNPESYDVIFMDVQMPEMDGYEATRRIRALPGDKAKQIPIIAMTANVFREDIEKCITSGMNDHIGKPLDIDEVVQKLHTYLLSTPHSLPKPEETLPESDSPPESDHPETDQTNHWQHGIAWNAELETGNEEIDTQHKQLFKLTSNLVDACAKNQSPAVLSQTLDFLATYTVRHFADEEALQRRYHYPGYQKHKQLHDNFKETVGDLIAQYNTEGSSIDLSDKANTVIVRWLIKHISQEDFKIAAYIRQRTISPD
ncbi:MAG: bacteriohemerythrin, partial [Peptococcaceae bacterium]|nr:bacteriohemerythrin [Peptococcaceae bacterium]